MRRVVLSFSGSGHLLIYQCGVAVRLLASRVAQSIVSFAGSSGGATAAAVCALLRTPDAIERFVDEHAVQCDGFGGLARSVLGVLPPTMIDREGGSVPQKSLLDDDVVRKLSGSLFIGATECRTGRRAIFSNYESGQSLMRCILASSAIPRSAHPFDLLRSPANPPTYPESSGVVIPNSCEHPVRLSDDLPCGHAPRPSHVRPYFFCWPLPGQS